MAVNTWGEDLNTWNDGIESSIITISVSEVSRPFTDASTATVVSFINGDIIETGAAFSDSFVGRIPTKWIDITPAESVWVDSVVSANN